MGGEQGRSHCHTGSEQGNTRLRQMDGGFAESMAQKQQSALSSQIQTLRSALPDLQYRQPNNLARTPLPKARPWGDLMDMTMQTHWAGQTPKSSWGASVLAVLGAVGSLLVHLAFSGKTTWFSYLAFGQGGKQQTNEGAVGILPPRSPCSCLLSPFPAPAPLTGDP